MTNHILTTTFRRKKVPVKYLQQQDGVYKVKGTDGQLYQLAEFTCDQQFLNFCNAFDLRDSRRNNPVQAA